MGLGVAFCSYPSGDGVAGLACPGQGREGLASKDGSRTGEAIKAYRCRHGHGPVVILSATIYLSPNRNTFCVVLQ